MDRIASTSLQQYRSQFSAASASSRLLSCVNIQYQAIETRTGSSACEVRDIQSNNRSNDPVSTRSSSSPVNARSAMVTRAESTTQELERSTASSRCVNSVPHRQSQASLLEQRRTQGNMHSINDSGILPALGPVAVANSISPQSQLGAHQSTLVASPSKGSGSQSTMMSPRAAANVRCVAPPVSQLGVRQSTSESSPRHGPTSRPTLMSPRAPADVRRVAPFVSQLLARQSTLEASSRNSSGSRSMMTSPRAVSRVLGVTATAGSVHPSRHPAQPVPSHSADQIELQEMVANTTTLAQCDTLRSPRISSTRVLAPQFVSEHAHLQNDSTNTIFSSAHSTSIFDQKTAARKELEAKMAKIALTFEDGDVEFMDRALARDKARRIAKRASLLATAPHLTPSSTVDVPEPENFIKEEFELEADDPRLVCIQKVDARSGRPYWVNLKTKVTSWTPPDGWIAFSAVTLSSAVATSSTSSVTATTSGRNDVVTKAPSAPAVAGSASSHKIGKNPMSAFHFVSDNGTDSAHPPAPPSPPPSPPPPPFPDDWC